MSYLKFYLENPRNEELSYIRCAIKINTNLYYRFYLREKIKSVDWNKSKQRVRKSNKNHASINHYLDRLAAKIDDHYRISLIDKTLSMINMQKFVNSCFGKDIGDFWEVWDMVIKEKETQNQSSSKNTLPDKYKNIRNKLREFNPRMTWRDIDIDMLYRWVNWLYEEYELSTNTVHRYIKFFKTFLNESKKRKYHDLDSYKDFHIDQKDTLNPYLTIDEINILHDLEVSDPFLNSVRINLLKGVYSGQRHSDWGQLRPHNMVSINSEDFYQVVQTKTKKIVLIPAHDKLRDVVNQKHIDIDNQQFNLACKGLCQYAGINSIFIKPSYKGGKMIQTTYKKYELVASHIARRSFVCNNLKAKIPVAHIMKVGGWSDYDSFKKYIQLSSTDGLDQFEGVYS